MKKTYRYKLINYKFVLLCAIKDNLYVVLYFNMGLNIRTKVFQYITYVGTYCEWKIQLSFIFEFGQENQK